MAIKSIVFGIEEACRRLRITENELLRLKGEHRISIPRFVNGRFRFTPEKVDEIRRVIKGEGVVSVNVDLLDVGDQVLFYLEQIKALILKRRVYVRGYTWEQPSKGTLRNKKS